MPAVHLIPGSLEVVLSASAIVATAVGAAAVETVCEALDESDWQ